MHIGERQREVIVEPLEMPTPLQQPTPAPEPEVPEIMEPMMEPVPVGVPA